MSAKRGTEDLDFFIGDEALTAANGQSMVGHLAYPQELRADGEQAMAYTTLYDMVKGVQRDVRVEDLRLLAKRGGRSGDYVAT